MSAIENLKQANEARECELQAPKQIHPPLRSLSEVEAERHNAYAWIKPNADACEVCGKKEFATPVDGFVVRECTNCERLICEDHADTDADCDQDGYFTTSWTCNSGCETVPIHLQNPAASFAD